MSMLIKNITLVNPDGLQKEQDILVQGGKIEKIGKGLICPGAQVIDGTGKTAFPGLIDMHVHLREPGYEYKEDITSGSKAAVKGGFTAVACMPNTDPVNDNKATLSYIKQRAQETDLCHVYPICAITKNLMSQELTEMATLQSMGAVAFSDDGRPVTNSKMMRNALLYAKDIDALLISHCEDLELRGDGVVSEGLAATTYGLRVIPKAAEEVAVARDILIAEDCGAKIHIAHVSTKGSIELIRQAKKRGVRVTAETAPHYFSANDSMIGSYDTSTKVNPPLRGQEDVEAVIEGLMDGTIDAIATDHAPHHVDDKEIEYDLAAFGISGIEMALSLAITKLYETGKLDLPAIAQKMSAAPADILGVPGGRLQEGMPADITLADLHQSYVVKREDIVSKGKNCPYIGWELKGVITHTIVGGQIKYEREK